jgi:hypothetical protein
MRTIFTFAFALVGCAAYAQETKQGARSVLPQVQQQQSQQSQAHCPL